MKTLIKMFVYLGIVAGGAYLVLDRIPSLKANILETVNPRVQEGQLVRTLQRTLEELDSALPGSGGTAAETTATTQKKRELIEESQELLQKIADINDKRDSVAVGIVSKVTDALIGTAVSPATPIISPVATPCAP